MLNPNLPEPELLKAILQPMLEDFQYWFARSRQLLETENIPFLSDRQQSDILDRIKYAQQEVHTAKTLFHATGGQVGIEMKVLMPWHQLLTECWQIATRFRLESSHRIENGNPN
jgi:hypothetical protein